MEIGPTASGGLGPTPVTFTEIDAWVRLTGTPLLPWEARFIHRLSREWCGQASISDDRTCPPPWAEEPLRAAELRAVADSLRESI